LRPVKSKTYFAEAPKTRNQGARRIMDHMLAIAPWLAETDRAALRAWCELEWLTRRVMLVLTEPDLPQDQTLKWSAEYLALRQTQNTIGNGLGLDGSLPETVGERDENSLKLLLLILTVIE
jgi:hypothetical protein